jgi:UDP-glucose 4-epimerase
MRIAITGATGNVGSALLRALQADDDVEEILAIARRAPAPGVLPPKARPLAADIVSADLEPALRGFDAVVHLAWLIQPMRDRAKLRAVNVAGSARVFDAAVRAKVPAIVHASSIGAYSPAPAGTRVREDHPTGGTPSSVYSVDKVACERLLDRLEADHPGVRVTRLRPGLIFQRDAAHEQLGYFLGGRPPVVSRLLGRGLPGVLPLPPTLQVQAVHADDVADAYRRAALAPDADGAFNVAAEPPLGPRRLAGALNALPVPVPAAALRAGMAAAFRLRAIPTEPGWLDMGMAVPVMDCARIERELGWRPRHSGVDALKSVIQGTREDAMGATPPLQVPSSR